MLEEEAHRLDGVVSELLDFTRPIAPQSQRLDVVERVARESHADDDAESTSDGSRINDRAVADRKSVV